MREPPKRRLTPLVFSALLLASLGCGPGPQGGETPKPPPSTSKPTASSPTSRPPKEGFDDHTFSNLIDRDEFFRFAQEGVAGQKELKFTIQFFQDPVRRNLFFLD